MVRISERFTRARCTCISESLSRDVLLTSEFLIVDDVLVGESVTRLLDGAKRMVVGGGAHIH